MEGCKTKGGSHCNFNNMLWPLLGINIMLWKCTIIYRTLDTVMPFAQVISELYIAIYLSCGVSVVCLLLTITAIVLFRYVNKCVYYHESQ